MVSSVCVSAGGAEAEKCWWCAGAPVSDLENWAATVELGLPELAVSVNFTERGEDCWPDPTVLPELCACTAPDLCAGTAPELWLGEAVA